MPGHSSIMLFCEKCQAYLNPCRQDCPDPECGHVRPISDCLPPPGMPYWTTHLAGPAVGSIRQSGGRLLAAWGRELSNSGAEPAGGLVWIDLHSGQTQGPGFQIDRPVRGEMAMYGNNAVLCLGPRVRLGSGAVVCIDFISCGPCGGRWNCPAR